MATFADIGLIQYFDFIFPFLFVFALVFALLQKTKVIGDSIGINALIAVVSGIMVLLSRTITEMINYMIPWFVVAIIFFVLVILIFQVMGARDADFSSAIKDRVLRNTLIGVVVVILLASFAHVFGQQFTEVSFGGDQEASAVDGVSTGSDFSSNITKIITNPKVLGFLTLFGIAIFAVALLTNKEQ